MKNLWYIFLIFNLIAPCPAKSQNTFKDSNKVNQNNRKAFVPSQESLNGTWAGTYFCPQGITRVNLQMTVKNSGQVEAILNFSPHPDNPTVPSGSFTMTGTYQKNTSLNAPGTIYLKAIKWLKQPPGYRATDLQGNVFLSEKRISGTVLSPGCSTFDVIKQ